MIKMCNYIQNLIKLQRCFVQLIIFVSIIKTKQRFIHGEKLCRKNYYIPYDAYRCKIYHFTFAIRLKIEGSITHIRLICNRGTDFYEIDYLHLYSKNCCNFHENLNLLHSDYRI